MNISANTLFKGTAALGTTLTSSGVASSYATKNSSLNKDFQEKNNVINEDQEFETKLRSVMENEIQVFSEGSYRNEKCKHWSGEKEYAPLSEKQKLVQCYKYWVALAKEINEPNRLRIQKSLQQSISFK